MPRQRCPHCKKCFDSVKKLSYHIWRCKSNQIEENEKKPLVADKLTANGGQLKLQNECRYAKTNGNYRQLTNETGNVENKPIDCLDEQRMRNKSIYHVLQCKSNQIEENEKKPLVADKLTANGGQLKLQNECRYAKTNGNYRQLTNKTGNVENKPIDCSVSLEEQKIKNEHIRNALVEEFSNAVAKIEAAKLGELVKEGAQVVISSKKGVQENTLFEIFKKANEAVSVESRKLKHKKANLGKGSNNTRVHIAKIGKVDYYAYFDSELRRYRAYRTQMGGVHPITTELDVYYARAEINALQRAIRLLKKNIEK